MVRLVTNDLDNEQRDRDGEDAVAERFDALGFVGVEVVVICHRPAHRITGRRETREVTQRRA